MIDNRQNQQFRQSPNEYRQWGTQIAGRLRQDCQQIDEQTNQVVRNADQLKRELTNIAQVLLQTCATIADRLEQQVQIGEATQRTFQTQRSSLSPLARAGVGSNAFDTQSTQAVAQALEDQLASMQAESEPRRGAVR